MRSMTALAAAETRMLARNRSAAFNALALPLGFGALLLLTGGHEGAPGGPVAALQVIAVLAFTLFSTAVTLLVARRQQRVLKRWRSSAASTATILAGTLAPLGMLLAVQAGVLLAATALVTGAAPASPGILAIALAAGAGLCGALGFVTAAYTRTVESTAVTAAPVVGALLVGALWVLQAAPADVTVPMLATGGGAVAQLVRLGWDGLEGAGPGALAAVGPPLAALAALTLAAVAAATRLFRWEPRA